MQSPDLLRMQPPDRSFPLSMAVSLACSRRISSIFSGDRSVALASASYTDGSRSSPSHRRTSWFGSKLSSNI
nr:hypothetical protein Iba_chr04bCG20540 [Ipomoea batatas]